MPISSGLIFKVDAGDPASYSGSGSTWSDISGSGNHVTLSSSPTWNSSGWFTFNGSSSQYGTFSPTSLPGGNSPFTAIVWVRRTGANSVSGPTVSLAWGTDASAQSIVPYVYNSSFWAGSYAYDFTYGGAVDNRWYMVVMAHDGTTCRLYVNGQQVTSAARTYNVGKTYARIGSDNSNNSFKGDIAAAEIYNRALTAAEIFQLYGEFIPRIYPTSSGPTINLDASNPASYPGSGTVWTDISGVGNNNVTFYSGTPTYSSTGWLNLNGSTYGTFANPIDGFVLGNDPRTYSVWVYSTTSEYSQTVMNLSQQAAVYYNRFDITLFNANGGYDSGYFNSDVYGSSIYASGCNPRTWYNIVVTYDNTVRRMYVNGALVASGTRPEINTQTLVAYLCSSSTSGGFLRGSIGSFKVHNRVLGPAEIATEYSNTRTRFVAVPSDDVNMNTLSSYTQGPGLMVGIGIDMQYSPTVNTIPPVPPAQPPKPAPPPTPIRNRS